ncbi:hypothetical protein HZ326_31776 [Fusarium oxysporum f. sp. albedinis]|nr:hypothetical protein HZ326_31776 [Fusarium oxysporum f. sp. albedinis]
MRALLGFISLDRRKWEAVIVYANDSQEVTNRAHQINSSIISVVSRLIVLLNTAGLDYPGNEWFCRLIQPPHFQPMMSAARRPIININIDCVSKTKAFCSYQGMCKDVILLYPPSPPPSRTSYIDIQVFNEDPGMFHVIELIEGNSSHSLPVSKTSKSEAKYC